MVRDGEAVGRGPVTARDKADRARLGMAAVIVLGVMVVLGVALAVV